MRREGPYIIDDDVQDHSCFDCNNFDRRLFWNSLFCKSKKRRNKLKNIRYDPEMLYIHPAKTNKCKFWEPHTILYRGSHV